MHCGPYLELLGFALLLASSTKFSGSYFKVSPLQLSSPCLVNRYALRGNDTVFIYTWFACSVFIVAKVGLTHQIEMICDISSTVYEIRALSFSVCTFWLTIIYFCLSTASFPLGF